VELNAAIPIDGLDTEVLMRLAVAAVIGLLLGLDRELRGHAAGLRTHGIICFSAAIMTVSMLSLYQQLGSEGTRMDPLRIFEGTGAFIGIVAAGLIVVSKGEVHNLTTAAHIWLASVIGIACGAGQWPLVAIGSVMAFFMITLLGFIETEWLQKWIARNGNADDS